MLNSYMEARFLHKALGYSAHPCASPVPSFGSLIAPPFMASCDLVHRKRKNRRRTSPHCFAVPRQLRLHCPNAVHSSTYMDAIRVYSKDLACIHTNLRASLLILFEQICA